MIGKLPLKDERGGARPGKAGESLVRGRVGSGLPWAWGRARRRRRGVGIALVMGLISVALAMAYALLRSQSLNVLIQGNGSLRNEAREAALSELCLALFNTNEFAYVD